MVKNLLGEQYAIRLKEQTVVDEKTICMDGEYYYLIIEVKNKEVIHMEQAALAEYLVENGYTHTFVPIPNVNGEWLTAYDGQVYLVLKTAQFQHDTTMPHGQQLAAFHAIGSTYPFEPKKISSYGKWKELWINKLTVYETKAAQEAKKHPSAYYENVMNMLPYMIGMSENAIQYVQESEQDNRFHEHDQGTICFHRYTGQLLQPALWPVDFVYDHPARDLAEYIRARLLNHNLDSAAGEIVQFLQEYQQVHPLSVFGLRLLYARLLFPVHLFDLVGQGFLHTNPSMLFDDLIKLCNQQIDYEAKLRMFFKLVGVDPQLLHIPMLHWL